MDYNKIGNFIMTERKAKKLTQEKLAHKIFVSEKTISKWEKGKGIPDTNTLPKLCEVFGVTINELLNGERITTEKYTNKAEEKILELQKAKEASDKRLLRVEIVLGILSLISFFIILLTCLYAIYELNITVTPTIIIVIDFALFLIAMFCGLHIEQKAGFYVCKKCNHKYTPTYCSVFSAMHIGRTRYMKCPHCHKWSWNKKIVK